MKRLVGTQEIIVKQLVEERLTNQVNQKTVDTAVAEIIANVRKKGDDALFAYSQQFDKMTLTSLEIGQEQIAKAFDEIDSTVLLALKNAKINIETYHRQQLETGFEDKPSEGVIRGQLVRPLSRVGVYVPGGTAAYPSSVLMNVLPAKIAGVKEVIMITPPQEHFNPAILVAASLSGVDKIFQIGGAQGIAALAYGTQTIPKVDKITGPGNIYVATAKKQVFGLVGIDMIAGPSEIGIIADDSANARFVAADLLSQAEHDVLARTILVTNSKRLADEVEKELAYQLERLPRKDIAQKALNNHGCIIIAETVEEMFALMNEVAPEHLEVALDEPYAYLDLIENAGSIFLGHYTSEPIGDYYAGTNHILPTSGTARFYSALGVHDFVKRMQYIQYNKPAVAKASTDIMTLAYAEGLSAHARAIEIRQEGEKS
ncbi:histidinol dehydrogenase [Streptococcus sciuri]|uniref:Histidinol dehydrogenase n=1 Tax=Streptococcus sciuri TaxID=2973939 RepID=A0ABT2F7F8_9STRE|nr:histidinol dehydrogenase [Streptococcus sciuri]MCS4488128.1 histidinol dehydrogenase [Streptococcus sciuri]